jgi:hypothetical protein
MVPVVGRVALGMYCSIEEIMRRRVAWDLGSILEYGQDIEASPIWKKTKKKLNESAQRARKPVDRAIKYIN